jgi:hypothetical protein
MKKQFEIQEIGRDIGFPTWEGIIAKTLIVNHMIR